MASINDERKTVSEELVRTIASQIVGRTLRRMDEKGSGSFVHRHEVMGCIQEEWHELIEASHARDYDKMKSELQDIAVAAIFSIASLELML